MYLCTRLTPNIKMHRTGSGSSGNVSWMRPAADRGVGKTGIVIYNQKRFTSIKQFPMVLKKSLHAEKDICFL
jgi:hypothetical protein